MNCSFVLCCVLWYSDYELCTVVTLIMYSSCVLWVQCTEYVLKLCTVGTVTMYSSVYCWNSDYVL